MDSHFLLWPIALGSWTPTLECGPLSYGQALARFCMVPTLGVMDSHAFMWPVKLGLRASMLVWSTCRCR